MFFNQLGEFRDRSFEQQRYRASGLNLLTAAIVLWNTVSLDRTITTLDSDGSTTDPGLLRFLSPMGWEHVNLTGDYIWPRPNHIKPGKYRPLARLSAGNSMNSPPREGPHGRRLPFGASGPTLGKATLSRWRPDGRDSGPQLLLRRAGGAGCGPSSFVEVDVDPWVAVVLAENWADMADRR
ncbi:hypothetical protein ABIB14_003678 [Arthrobacter sp. UYEF3]